MLINEHSMPEQAFHAGVGSSKDSTKNTLLALQVLDILADKLPSGWQKPE